MSEPKKPPEQPDDKPLRRRTASRKEPVAVESATPTADTPAQEPTPAEGEALALSTRADEALEGVPDQYDDGVRWLANGFLRQRTASMWALVLSWTGVWLCFWGATFGLVIGALAASSLGQYVGTPFGIGQAGSAIGFLGGAVAGAVGGFLATLRFLVVEQPLQAVASVISGAVLAAIIVVVIAAFEHMWLRLRGYRRLSRREVRRIAPLVKDASDRMDLPALPRFAMDDSLVPNAWTHMRTIVITTGLLQTLSDAELRAVLTHELEHWRQGDSVGLRFVWAAAWPVALAFNAGMAITGKRGGGQGSQKQYGAIRSLLGWIIAWAPFIIIRFVITPLVAVRQRACEFEADQAAASIGYASDLSSALSKMAAFEGGRTGWEQAMSATHPPTELRIEALEPVRDDDWQYQEQDFRLPTPDEVGRLFTFWRRDDGKPRPPKPRRMKYAELRALMEAPVNTPEDGKHPGHPSPGNADE